MVDAGFNVEITDGFVTGPACQCENNIVQQWPPAGTRAEQGSAVEITVGGPGPTVSGSMGLGGRSYEREVPLPQLVGLRLSAANDWLSRHDLGWSAHLARLPATNRKDLLDAYVVTAQQPSKGSQVGVWDEVRFDAAPTDGILAEWHESKVVVPYVSGGRDLPSAYDRLHARGLRVATNRRLSHGPYIPVLSQRPGPGTQVRRGTTVTLNLDPKVYARAVSGDHPRLPMPNVVGRDLGELAEWLERNDLYWELVDAPALPPTSSPHLLDPYVVTSQKPSAATRVPQMVPGSSSDIAPIRLRVRLKAG